MKPKFDKILSEGIGLSEAARQQIAEAWEASLADTRKELEEGLREEFAQKYQHDKATIVEAMDKFLTEQIRAEISEFQQDKKAIAEQRVKMVAAAAKQMETVEKFVTEAVAKEVKAMIAERKNFKASLSKLDEFVANEVKRELEEFQADKRAVVAEKVKLVRESANAVRKAKQEVVSKSKKVISETLDKMIKSEIKQFREDITAARQNDFGRRVFESFVTEYAASYLNEGTEVSKLNKVLQAKEKELASLAESAKRAEEIANGYAQKLKESVAARERDATLTQLLAPLSVDKRKLMGDLLAPVKTDKLQEAFNKYVGAVLNETVKPGSEVIAESVGTNKTGNRATRPNQSGAEVTVDGDSSELSSILKLAGIQK